MAKIKPRKGIQYDKKQKKHCESYRDSTKLCQILKFVLFMSI